MKRALSITLLALLLAPGAAAQDEGPAALVLNPIDAIERGGAYNFHVRSWHNASPQDYGLVNLTSSDARAIQVLTGNISNPGPSGAPLMIRSPNDAPLGNVTLTFRVTWQSGETRTINLTVRVEPARYGVSFAPLQPRVSYGPEGGTLRVNVTNVADDPHWFRIDHEIADAQIHVKNFSAETLIGARSTMEFTTPIRYDGLRNANGTHTLNVSLAVRDRPVTARNQSFAMPIDFVPAAQPNDAVAITASPERQSVNLVGNASYTVTLREAAGRVTRVHLDANATTIGPGAPPSARLDNMAFLLQPGEARSVRLEVRAGPTTFPGEHPIRIVATSEDTLKLLDEATVIFDVNLTAPLFDIVAVADPVTAAPNTSATVRIEVFNPTNAEIVVRASTDADVILNTPSLTLARGAQASLDAVIGVGADVAIGSTLERKLTLRGNGEQQIDLVVLVAAPAAPAPPAKPSLRDAAAAAGEMAKTKPAATVSLALAGAGVVGIALLRRERVQYVLAAAALPLYTRLAKPEMLADERRGEIHALTSARPGIHLGALREEMKLSSGATVHHLRMLERHGYVVSRREGKLRRFFPSGLAPTEPTALPSAIQEQVLGLLAGGALTRPEISARLGMSQQSVSYHVKNLERAGRVVIVREGGVARVQRVTDIVVFTPLRSNGPDP